MSFDYVSDAVGDKRRVQEIIPAPSCLDDVAARRKCPSKLQLLQAGCGMEGIIAPVNRLQDHV